MKQTEDDTKNETTALKQVGDAVEKKIKYTNFCEDGRLTDQTKQPDSKLRYVILSLICFITLAM